MGALTRALPVPAVHIAKTQAPARSHLGGRPALPASVAWPEHGGQRLDFLTRIELAELHGALPVDWLPSSGALLFFYDTANQPWGFDPGDRGCCAVLHVAEEREPLRIGLAAGVARPLVPVEFRRVDSYPSWERGPVAALALTDTESDAYAALRDAPFEGRPQHQVGGFPSPVQGDDMELQCQLVSHGLYCGDRSGYEDPRTAELAAGSADWRLLLQLDSDGDLGVMWGDGGMVYFWIREQDARANAFDRAWLILQCA
jgi:hypothetical protein